MCSEPEIRALVFTSADHSEELPAQGEGNSTDGPLPLYTETN